MKKISVYMLSGMALLATACNRNDLDIPGASLYAQIYMPQAHQYPHLQNVYVVDSVQNVLFNAFYGGVAAPSTDITVAFKIDPGLVDSFNLRNGTAYPVLPQQNYALDTPESVIPAHRLSSGLLKLKITPVGLKVNQAYLLPVSIQSASGNNKISSALRTTYFLISGGYPPGEVVPWNHFKALMVFGKHWLVTDQAGDLWDYPTDAGGNFGPPRKMDSGWDQYDLVFPYGDAIVERKAADGSLWRTPVYHDDSLGAAEQIGLGWDIFTDIFGYKGSLICIRKDNGALWQYPLDDQGNFGASRQIGNGWNGLAWVSGSGDAILAVNGSALWRYPLDADGNFDYGHIMQVGTGWDVFTLLDYDSGTNALLARKADGTLWRYPLDDNDTPGIPEKIGH